jgi:hypothetical protein
MSRRKPIIASFIEAALNEAETAERSGSLPPHERILPFITG